MSAPTCRECMRPMEDMSYTERMSISAARNTGIHDACALDASIVDGPAKALFYATVGMSTLDRWEGLKPEVRAHYVAQARIVIGAFLKTMRGER